MSQTEGKLLPAVTCVAFTTHCRAFLSVEVQKRLPTTHLQDGDPESTSLLLPKEVEPLVGLPKQMGSVATPVRSLDSCTPRYLKQESTSKAAPLMCRTGWWVQVLLDIHHHLHHHFMTIWSIYFKWQYK